MSDIPPNTDDNPVIKQLRQHIAHLEGQNAELIKERADLRQQLNVATTDLASSNTLREELTTNNTSLTAQLTKANEHLTKYGNIVESTLKARIDTLPDKVKQILETKLAAFTDPLDKQSALTDYLEVLGHGNPETPPGNPAPPAPKPEDKKSNDPPAPKSETPKTFADAVKDLSWGDAFVENKS